MYIVKNSLNLGFVKTDLYSKLYGILNGTLHIFIIYGLSILGIFSFNIRVLVITFFITLIILIGNIILHDCPLSNIEQERLRDSYVDKINNLFPINYDKKRRYEVQLQYIFTLISIILCKLIYFLIFYDSFNFFKIKYT